MSEFVHWGWRGSGGGTVKGRLLTGLLQVGAIAHAWCEQCKQDVALLPMLGANNVSKM